VIDLAKLSEPFPRDAVSWRAQHFTSDGTKALALAYIDARDVMNRLDDVCGIGGWQCKYSHANGKTVCDIGIICQDAAGNSEWIWKADGAGDSDIEAEKGALSDAFKRAAVRWGIGRYLYNLEAVWCPCKTEERNGKRIFKSWVGDPWTHVKPEQKAGFETAKQASAKWQDIQAAMIAATTEADLDKVGEDYKIDLAILKRGDGDVYGMLVDTGKARRLEIQQEKAMREGMPQGFNSVPKFLEKEVANAKR
jgi:hypothetical protein